MYLQCHRKTVVPVFVSGFWRSCHTKPLVSRKTNLKPDHCLGSQLRTWTLSPDLGQTSITLSFHPYLWFYIYMASTFRPQEVSCVLPPKLKMVESQVDFIPLTVWLLGAMRNFLPLGCFSQISCSRICRVKFML